MRHVTLQAVHTHTHTHTQIVKFNKIKEIQHKDMMYLCDFVACKII